MGDEWLGRVDIPDEASGMYTARPLLSEPSTQVLGPFCAALFGAPEARSFAQGPRAD